MTLVCVNLLQSGKLAVCCIDTLVPSIIKKNPLKLAEIKKKCCKDVVYHSDLHVYIYI